ncbi:efflux RND transporter periplasmic adaptor subunit [Lutimonas saemankumensis]|uniref:efflux RND transporter periplasmic adaptor subunit n=1 Tax=Lutimonas saemankumensis TaxID=483016 RepID=UPI001CD34982|nr:efflux RND transporter periplasmic adaptor subunit [Lutimonas saemankumensis]MCA0932104.1 efflux RND transporter periplasmic adaptor subunit [Lutimonas saemankumensis]
MKPAIQNFKIITLVVLTGIISLSCSDQKDRDQELQAPVTVEIEKSESPSEGSYFNASGQIEAEEFARISTRVMGYVTKVYVKVGQQVHKGDALIDINNSDVQAKKAEAESGVLQAQARYNSAEKDLKRYQNLYNQNSASEKELEEIKTHFEIAKAQLEGAVKVRNEVEDMLSYSNVKAPFSGVITSKSVKKGDLAKPGFPLLNLERPGQYIAAVMVPESQISYIKVDSKVNVLVKSSGQNILGIVDEVSTSSFNSGGQYLVKIKLDKHQKTSLYSGMFVSASFKGCHEMFQPVLIPNSAIVRKGDLQGIYTVSSSGTAILRWLKLGKNHGEFSEVLSGLAPGEEYIVKAEGKLYNGARLNIK